MCNDGSKFRWGIMNPVSRLASLEGESRAGNRVLRVGTPIGLCSLLLLFLSSLGWAAEMSDDEKRHALVSFREKEQLYHLAECIVFPGRNVRCTPGEALSQLVNDSSTDGTRLLVALLGLLDAGDSEYVAEVLVNRGSPALEPMRMQLAHLAKNRGGTLESQHRQRFQADVIVSLMRLISYGIRGNEEGGAHRSPQQQSRDNIYAVQRELEMRFCQNHDYPANLSDVVDDEVLEDAWGRRIDYFKGDGFYFIRSWGQDGIPGNEDDLPPVIEKDLHTFPKRVGD